MRQWSDSGADVGASAPRTAFLTRHGVMVWERFHRAL